MRRSKASLLLPALILITLAAYHPAWHGGLLWDDEGHVTPVALRSASGLWRIWFEIGATQQYYPALHSAFWLLHRLFGDDTFGYHLVNIVLHACSAFLVAVILRRLRVPGAMLAAAIFALHPVQVESVAWISELKNVLSGVAYFGAALAYLRFHVSRTRAPDVWALALFVVALLSKTVTATLPAGLLAVCWWQRGRLEWRRDIRPLVPFVALGAAAGVMTAWVEHAFIGASGVEFRLTMIERGLLAGRAFFFYLGTLAWPLNLTFSYPKWAIAPNVWWQYLYPLGALTLAAALWMLRKKWRAPFAALAFFAVTLAPALGFVSVFPFRYSFVADHFQYLACVGPIALAAAGLTLLARRLSLDAALAGIGIALSVIAPLAALTRSESRQYVSSEVLYRSTIERNPSSWMAHLNLGIGLQTAGRFEEAAEQYRTALAIEPRSVEGHQNLGLALEKLGRVNEAVSELREALRLKPDNPEAHLILGACWQDLGRLDEAIGEFREALRLKPDHALAALNLAATLDARGRLAESIEFYQAAVRLDPGVADAHFRFGNALARLGRTDGAIADFQETLRLKPDFTPARENLVRLMARRD